MTPNELEGFGLRGTSGGDLPLAALFISEPDVVDAVEWLRDVHCPLIVVREGNHVGNHHSADEQKLFEISSERGDLNP